MTTMLKLNVKTTTLTKALGKRLNTLIYNLNLRFKHGLVLNF